MEKTTKKEGQEVKLTKSKLRSLVKEEKRGAKRYRHYGLRSLAKQEFRHARVLTRKLKAMK